MNAQVLLLTGCGITLLSLVVASFLPESRVWGINHFAFYPLWVRITALVAVAIAFAAGFARSVSFPALTGRGAWYLL